MSLLILLLALIFLQLWSGSTVLHKDRWIEAAYKKCSVIFPLSFQPYIRLIIAIVVSFLVWFTLHLIQELSYFLLLPFHLLILIYSMGRKNFYRVVDATYFAMVNEDSKTMNDLGGELGERAQVCGADTLFNQLIWRGYDRIFAAVFWFIFLGPVAALFYRLLSLLTQDSSLKNDIAVKILGVLDWPAQRVLAISMTLVGNFSQCLEYFAHNAITSPENRRQFLCGAVKSALFHQPQLGEQISSENFLGLKLLYRRTLVLWLVIYALVVIVL